MQGRTEASKRAVDRPMTRKFQGATRSRNGAKLKVIDKVIEKLKDRVRQLTRRTRGTSIGICATIELLHELGTTQPCATVGIQFIEPPDT